MRALVFAVLAGLFASSAPASAGVAACDPNANGTFRFLTNDLPSGATNADYRARLLTANADGPVTFSLDVGDALPTGLALDPETGLLTGRPTGTFDAEVTFVADDGPTSIQTTIHLLVSAGGAAGLAFTTTSLPTENARVGYTASLTGVGGVGPFVLGAADLPHTFTVDGDTGTIGGFTNEPGVFRVRFTAFDLGSDDEVTTVLPIVVTTSLGFRFVTELLNNGEVGTPYCDTWVTENSVGAPTFAASGLPAGLSLDPASGVVSGTPTESGTFPVVLTALNDGETVTTTRDLVIAPASASGFHWNEVALPSALVGRSYEHAPPTFVAASSHTGAVAYSVSGLPSGLAYDPTSGELTGTPTEVGDYPLTFTAVDGANDETLTFRATLLVLPPTGGDAGQIPVNLWVTKESVKVGEPGEEAWRVSAVYNADRRAANRFDPATESMTLRIAGRILELPPGSLAGATDKVYAWRSAKGAVPAESVKLGPAKQTLAWTTKADTIGAVVPGSVTQDVTLGERNYRMLHTLDENGFFVPTFDFDRTAFVVRSGKLTKKGPGSDSAKLSLLLADPHFHYEAQTSALRVRILQDTTTLLDREFTALGDVADRFLDRRTGETLYIFKTLPDPASTDRIVKFGYHSGTGKMTLALGGLDLAAMAGGEAHLTVEVTIGGHTYFTGVTFFEPVAGSGRYSTTMP